MPSRVSAGVALVLDLNTGDDLTPAIAIVDPSCYGVPIEGARCLAPAKVAPSNPKNLWGKGADRRDVNRRGRSSSLCGILSPRDRENWNKQCCAPPSSMSWLPPIAG